MSEELSPEIITSIRNMVREGALEAYEGSIGDQAVLLQRANEIALETVPDGVDSKTIMVNIREAEEVSPTGRIIPLEDMRKGLMNQVLQANHHLGYRNTPEFQEDAAQFAKSNIPDFGTTETARGNVNDRQSTFTSKIIQERLNNASQPTSSLSR